MNRRGFTLVELLFAASLGAIVIGGFAAILGQMTRTSLRAARSQRSQGSVAEARRLVAAELRKTSWLEQPAISGTQSSTLSGCSNAAKVDERDPERLDPSQPVRWYAFCARGSRLYYHRGEGSCPGRYVCGQGAAVSFGDSAQPFRADFTRGAESAPGVEYALSMGAPSGRDAGAARAASVEGYLAYAAPAGRMR